jgi:hypothetical protein
MSPTTSQYGGGGVTEYVVCVHVHKAYLASKVDLSDATLSRYISRASVIKDHVSTYRFGISCTDTYLCGLLSTPGGDLAAAFDPKREWRSQHG